MLTGKGKGGERVAVVHAAPLQRAGKISYRTSAYHELIWAKWRMLHEALLYSRTVMFIDADVILFRIRDTAQTRY